jgi:N-acetylglucosaminyl-diphospho-decaprenol L-rhamnosyltransferase
LTPETELAPPEPTRISVVIVSLNREATLRQSLQLLGAKHQIIVVDNGSRDGSALMDAEFPSVQSMRLPKNFGLTKALNIGLRAADGEYLLCLHDDTLITEEAVSQLANYLEAHPDAGAVSPLLTDHNGQPLPQTSTLPTPAAPDPPLQTAADGDELAVECVSGAAIMFRAFFLRALRQIDERYGTYGSSIEICAQMRRAGKKVVVLRSVAAIHASSPSPVEQSALDGDRAAGTAGFLAKHHGFMSSLLYRIKTALGALFTFRFSVMSGAISGQKIDGTS